jgi:EmrB/QacA subfamily drug resistance transporter
MTAEHLSTAAPEADAHHGWVTLAIAGLAALATYLDTTVLFVAFPDITDSFRDSSASTLSWVLNAYTIAFAAFLVPAGKIADRVGHRRAFLVGSATFTLASTACGLAPTVGALVVARVLQGVGSATLVPASLALVMGAFPRERLSQVIAIWGAIGAMAAALGPSVGGLVVDAFGRRWAYFINLPIGALTIAAGLRFLLGSSDPTVRLPSPVGVVLVASAAAMLLYGIVGLDAAGWASAQTALALGGGLALTIAFVAHQQRTTSPTLDLGLFAIRDFRWGNLAMFSFSTSFAAMFLGMILFLVNVWHWSILQAGLAVAPGPALAAILAPRFGKLAGQIGQRPLVILGGVLAAAASLYRIAFLGADESYLLDFAIPLAVSAVAISLVFPQITSAAAQALPPNRVGVGGATTQAVRQFGGSLGVAFTVALLGTATEDAATRFNHLWWLVTATAITTSLSGLRLRPRLASAEAVTA